MAKPVKLEGVGTINFPDQATEDDIAQFVNSTPREELVKIAQQQAYSMPATPEPDGIKRQLGLTARALGPVGAGALAGAPFGPPGMAAGALTTAFGPAIIDPVIGLSNRYLGTNIPTTSQTMESLMSRMGLPEPRNQQERVVQAMTRGLTGSAGAARGFTGLATPTPATTTERVFEQMGRYPAQQTTAGTLASGAAQMGAERDVGQLGQMGLALGAGMMAPGGPKLPPTARVMEGAKAVVSPLSASGREVIIGNVLNRLAYDPAKAMENLYAAQPLVPGVRPTTAAVARDVGLAGAETPIRALDSTNAFAARLSQNQKALLDAFRGVSGRPGSISKAEAKRTAVAGPMREAAFENVQPVGVAPVFEHITGVLADPNKQRTVVQQAMDEVRNLIYKRVDPETGFADPRALYAVRKDISDMMAGKYGKEQANYSQARGELADVARQLDAVIEQGAPGFQQYMQKYAKISGGIDQMRMLQSMESKVTTGQPDIMTGEPVLQASGLRRELAKRREEMGETLPPSAQRRVDAVIDEINRGQAATAPGVQPPGSTTFKNLSVGNLIGKIVGQGLADNKTLRTMARPLDFLYKLPDEAIQQLLVDSMLDPQLAARLMNKANVMTIDNTATSLRNKAIQLGYGTYIGAQESMR